MLKEAFSLAEYVYTKLNILPEEEKWDSQRKMRSAANDLMFSCALAVGNGSPAGSEYEWGQVRKYALALQTIYRFVTRQHFIELDPEIVIRLDKLMIQVDLRIKESTKKSELLSIKEMAEWQEKYRIWSKVTSK